MAAGVTGAVGVGAGTVCDAGCPAPEADRTLVALLMLTLDDLVTLEVLVETETEPEHWAG